MPEWLDSGAQPKYPSTQPPPGGNNAPQADQSDRPVDSTIQMGELMVILREKSKADMEDYLKKLGDGCDKLIKEGLYADDEASRIALYNLSGKKAADIFKKTLVLPAPERIIFLLRKDAWLVDAEQSLKADRIKRDVGR